MAANIRYPSCVHRMCVILVYCTWQMNDAINYLLTNSILKTNSLMGSMCSKVFFNTIRCRQWPSLSDDLTQLDIDSDPSLSDDLTQLDVDNDPSLSDDLTQLDVDSGPSLSYDITQLDVDSGPSLSYVILD